MPDPAETTVETPPVSGGVNPEQPSQPTEETKPFFVANTQEEFEARFGPEKTQAKRALAKKYGYDSIEAMDTAMADYKKMQDANKTALELAQEEATTHRTAAETRAQELERIKLERASEKKAVTLGVDPSKLDTVMTLLQAGGEIPKDANGNVDDSALQTAIEGILTAHPYFKSGPTTIGTGSNPANAGGNVDVPSNPWSAATRNLTKQAEILRADPAMAKRLQSAAVK